MTGNISVLDMILVGIGTASLVTLCQYLHMPFYYSMLGSIVWITSYQYENWS